MRPRSAPPPGSLPHLLAEADLPNPYRLLGSPLVQVGLRRIGKVVIRALQVPCLHPVRVVAGQHARGAGGGLIALGPDRDVVVDVLRDGLVAGPRGVADAGLGVGVREQPVQPGAAAALVETT